MVLNIFCLRSFVLFVDTVSGIKLTLKVQPVARLTLSACYQLSYAIGPADSPWDAPGGGTGLESPPELASLTAPPITHASTDALVKADVVLTGGAELTSDKQEHKHTGGFRIPPADMTRGYQSGGDADDDFNVCGTREGAAAAGGDNGPTVDGDRHRVLPDGDRSDDGLEPTYLQLKVIKPPTASDARNHQYTYKASRSLTIACMHLSKLMLFFILS